MRKFVSVLTLSTLLVASMAMPVGSAVLHEPHQNTIKDKCKSGEVMLWHFVNNQTDRSSTGWIVVEWTNGSIAVFEGYADKTNRNVQHWWVRGPAGLKTATTWTDSGESVQLPGRLVLSDNECVPVKK